MASVSGLVHLFLAALTMCILGLTIGGGGGGLGAPALQALPTIPVLAALTQGRRSAYIWSGVVLLALLGIFAMGPMPFTRYPVIWLGPLRVLGMTVEIGILVAAIFWFDGQVTRRSAELNASREATLQLWREAEEARSEAEEASEAKSHFLATMSHEFRTPLTALVGTCELLRGQVDSGDQAHLDHIAASSHKLNRLVDDILDLSKLESETLRLKAVQVDLKTLVTEVGESLGRYPSASGVRLSYRHEGERFVAGDPTRLRQILTILGENALKFTTAGEVNIRCLGRRQTPDHVGVTFAVRDTGVGIALEDQETIFGLFNQLETSRHRPSQGVGLGLRIVRELVNIMGGTVSVESAPGMGATFTVEVDLPSATPPSTTPSMVPEDFPITVLLAEDEPVNQTVIRLMLERYGCTVEVVSDGEEAIAALTQAGANFDLVLMDCRMPKLGGIEATRHLRSKNVTIPIVALTANAADQDRTLCLEAGMDDFVSKPLTLPSLGDILTRTASGELASGA